MARHKLPHTVIWPKPEPCRVSYWVGVDRDGLKAAIAAQRGRQTRPTAAEIKYDPMIAATAALVQRKFEAKLRRELGR